MNMIEVEGLTKRFGDFTAVDHISFKVGERMVFGFLGPNGAGKSTAIRMLCTLLRPTEGNARVVGFDIVREQSEVRRHIGLVAEKIILYDQLTAEENLTLFGRLNNLPDEQIRQATDNWLERLRMEAWRKHRVGTFSTGMKQRINVARALLHHPDVLFLDEPTLGLDPQTTHAIHEFVQELREEGMTVVLTTHDMVEAETLCQQIAIIDQSRIVACDTTVNLKKLLSADNTTIIDVEIANLSEQMVSQLKAVESVASVVRPDTYRIRIHTRDADSLAPVLNALNAMGASVHTINTVLPTMEDVFLHVTGREMRDKATAGVPSVRAHRWSRVSRVR